MRVVSQVVGELSVSEIKVAICEYLARKWYRNCHISFSIQMETDSTDLHASFPAIPATSLTPEDYILELLYKKACEFGDTAFGVFEAKLIKEMKYAFMST